MWKKHAKNRKASKKVNEAKQILDDFRITRKKKKEKKKKWKKGKGHVVNSLGSEDRPSAEKGSIDGGIGKRKQCSLVGNQTLELNEEDDITYERLVNTSTPVKGPVVPALNGSSKTAVTIDESCYGKTSRVEKNIENQMPITKERIIPHIVRIAQPRNDQTKTKNLVISGVEHSSGYKSKEFVDTSDESSDGETSHVEKNIDSQTPLTKESIPYEARIAQLQDKDQVKTKNKLISGIEHSFGYKSKEFVDTSDESPDDQIGQVVKHIEGQRSNIQDKVLLSPPTSQPYNGQAKTMEFVRSGVQSSKQGFKQKDKRFAA